MVYVELLDNFPARTHFSETERVYEMRSFCGKTGFSALSALCRAVSETWMPTLGLWAPYATLTFAHLCHGTKENNTGLRNSKV